MSKKEFDEGFERTIFSNPQSHSSEERDGIKKGEKRGEELYVRDNPEKFGEKCQKGSKYRQGHKAIDWSHKQTMDCRIVGNKKIFTVKKIDSSSNTVTIDGFGSDTIEGELTYVLKEPGEFISFQTNDTDWFITASNTTNEVSKRFAVMCS